MALTGLASVSSRPSKASSSMSARTERGGAHLQEGGHLAQVGVPHDDVQPPVALRIGVRLVAGVDDGTLQGRLEPDLLLEELGSLRQLEGDVAPGVTRRLASHLPRPGEDLTGDEVRCHQMGDAGKGHGAVHEVVLVGAVRVALAVGVVLVDDDRLALGEGPAHRRHGAPQHLFPRLVEQHDLEGIGALRCRELGVGVVDVVAGAVGEHGVHEVRLHLGRQRSLAGEAAGIVARRLVLEVPSRPRQVRYVRVDEQGRRRDGVPVTTDVVDPVLGLDPAHLRDDHETDPSAWRLGRCVPPPPATSTPGPAQRY